MTSTTEILIAMMNEVMQKQTETLCKALVDLEQVRINGAAIIGYTESVRAESQDAAVVTGSQVDEAVSRANNSLDNGLDL